MKGLFLIDKYLAIIPHIQNIYAPEKDRMGWTFGFKYISGVCEFFTYKTLKETNKNYDRLIKSMEEYYKQEVSK